MALKEAPRQFQSSQEMDFFKVVEFAASTLVDQRFEEVLRDFNVYVKTGSISIYPTNLTFQIRSGTLTPGKTAAVYIPEDMVLKENNILDLEISTVSAVIDSTSVASGANASELDKAAKLKKALITSLKENNN